MKAWGFGFATLAVMLAIWWAVFDPTADAGINPTTFETMRVANLQRLHLQAALFQAALASAVIAAVCFVGEAVVERLNDGRAVVAFNASDERSVDQQRSFVDEGGKSGEVGELTNAEKDRLIYAWIGGLFLFGLIAVALFSLGG